MGGGSKQGRRFGIVAVEKGYITPEQLVEALTIQVDENIAKLDHRPIGMILLEQGLITLDQINEILLEMEEAVD